MKSFLLLQTLLFIGVVSLTASALTVDHFTQQPFGTVGVYKPDSATNALVIIISGDSGWNGTILPMAKMLASQNALVAGIDIQQYLRQLEKRPGDCIEAVADFHNLIGFLRKNYDLPPEMKPLLLGYSSGATLAYAILVQAPADIFIGGISFGFCPDLQINKALCRVESTAQTTNPGLIFSPAKSLQTRWYAFQGIKDEVCNEEATREYVEKVPNSTFVLLPRVGHGFHKPNGWLAEFRVAYKDLTHQELPENNPPFELPGQ